MPELGTFLLRAALCAAALAVAWRVGGATAIASTSLVVGLLLAKPLLELAIASWRGMRRRSLRDVEGRHFAYKGRPVRVETDAAQVRWIRLADIRAIAGFTASEAALRVTYPQGWTLRGRPPALHLSDEALLAHLAKERTPEALRLTRWVEREIVFPARRLRGLAPDDGPAQPRMRSTSEVVE